MQEFIKIHPADNVAVALTDLKRGYEINIEGSTVTLADDIDRGHKFTLCSIKKESPVIKYGFPIGTVREDVEAGTHIHVHNLRTGLGDNLEYKYEPDANIEKAEASISTSDAENGVENSRTNDEPAQNSDSYFMGYERSDGRAGVRNELWVVPTVGCVNSIAGAIAKQCQHLVTDNIEAVVSFSHPYGCSQMGDDQENTRKVLAALIKHPNAGGVLVLGLGCENSNIDVLKDYIGEFDKNRMRFLVCQDVDDEISEGKKLLEELAVEAAKVKRTKVSVDKLVIGLKCGGSDGLSGITANPAVGVLSDIITSEGGSTILTEVPEMFGAETILMNRCINKAVFDKTVKLINDFKDYFRRHNQTVYENPSPGNKKGGISTLEDKALGCTQKSGSSPVADVLAYAEQIKNKGLNLLSAPGNDLVASTALAVSGAQLVLFTTGRGTPFACAVPTVKISSNSQLADKKKNWIDFDAGRLLNEGMELNMLGRELYEYVLSVASGIKVKSEEDGYRDLAIFKQGVTL